MYPGDIIFYYLIGGMIIVTIILLVFIIIIDIIKKRKTNKAWWDVTITLKTNPSESILTALPQIIHYDCLYSEDKRYVITETKNGVIIKYKHNLIDKIVLNESSIRKFI